MFLVLSVEVLNEIKMQILRKRVILGNLFELSSNKYLLSSNEYRNFEFVQIQIQIRKKWPNLVQINTNTNTNKIWTQPWYIVQRYLPKQHDYIIWYAFMFM